MKKSLVLAMAMAMGVTASAYAANPFADVPAGHWAYDAVSQLADAGVVEGYAGAFGGDKLMTRYEMAQIVAKAMAKGSNCDKLAAEFADELDALGVRVAKLEKKADNVKITAQIRYSYKDSSFNDYAHGKETTDKNTYKGNVKKSGHGSNYNRFRTRLWVNGDINKNWKYTGLLENNRFLDAKNNVDDFKMPRAWLTGRIGGLKVEAGRMTFNYGSQYNDRLDGATIAYKFDKVNFKALAAKNLGVSKAFYGLKSFKYDSEKAKDWVTTEYKTMEDDDRMYAILLDTKLGKLDLGLNYFKLNLDNGNYNYDNEIAGVKVGYPFGKMVKFTAEGFFGKDDAAQGLEYDGDKFGYELRLSYGGAKASKPGSWGVWVGYNDRPYATYICPNMLNVWADVPFLGAPVGDGFRGFDAGANFTFAKNIVGTFSYANLKSREGIKDSVDTLWCDVTFNF